MRIKYEKGLIYATVTTFIRETSNFKVSIVLLAFRASKGELHADRPRDYRRWHLTHARGSLTSLMPPTVAQGGTSGKTLNVVSPRCVLAASFIVDHLEHTAI